MAVTRNNRHNFWDRVLVGDECWEWTGTHNPQGYGWFFLDGRHQLCHRLSYEMLRGEIPEGLVIDHLCRNVGCLKPSHLQPVTQAENLLRGVSSVAHNGEKTHCPNGHEYTLENTYIFKRNGSRQCNTCRKETMARYWATHPRPKKK